MGLVVLKDQDYQRYQRTSISLEPKLEIAKDHPCLSKPQVSQMQRAIWSALRLASVISILFIVFLVTYAKIGLAGH